jgi:ABC-type enterobactin transport system permease subunit
MIYFLSGVVVTGIGVGGLWVFKSRNGQVHPLAVMPVLDFMIPIGIVTALAVGAALMVSGIIA